MFSSLRLIAIPTLIFIMAGSTLGLEVSYDANFTNLSVPGTQNPNLTLPKFDPDLGTLQQVVLLLHIDTLEAGDALYDNEDPQNQASVELTTKGDIKAETMMAVSPLNVMIMTPQNIGSAVLATDGEVGAPADFIGPDSLTVLGLTVNNVTQQSTLNSNFSEYVGPNGNPGTFDVSLRTTAMFTVTIGGGFGQLKTEPGNSSGKVTVKYIYIPEPASLAMIGLGSVMVLRRRRFVR